MPRSKVDKLQRKVHPKDSTYESLEQIPQLLSELSVLAKDAVLGRSGEKPQLTDASFSPFLRMFQLWQHAPERCAQSLRADDMLQFAESLTSLLAEAFTKKQLEKTVSRIVTQFVHAWGTVFSYLSDVNVVDAMVRGFLLAARLPDRQASVELESLAFCHASEVYGGLSTMLQLDSRWHLAGLGERLQCNQLLARWDLPQRLITRLEQCALACDTGCAWLPEPAAEQRAIACYLAWLHAALTAHAHMELDATGGGASAAQRRALLDAEAQVVGTLSSARWSACGQEMQVRCGA